MNSLTAYTSASRNLTNFQELKVYGKTSSQNPGQAQMVAFFGSGTLDSGGADPSDATMELALVDVDTNTRLRSVYFTLSSTGYIVGAAGTAESAEDDVVVLDISSSLDSRGYLDLIGLQTKNAGSASNSSDTKWMVGMVGMGGFKSISIKWLPATRV